MAAVFFVNWCFMALALAVVLLVALSAHGWVDFQSLTGVAPGRAALYAAAVLIWTLPLAIGSFATHLRAGDAGESDVDAAESDAPEAWLWGGDDAAAR